MQVKVNNGMVWILADKRFLCQNVLGQAGGGGQDSLCQLH